MYILPKLLSQKEPLLPRDALRAFCPSRPFVTRDLYTLERLSGEIMSYESERWRYSVQTICRYTTPAQNATVHSYSVAFPTTSLEFLIDIIIIITLNCLHVAYLFY